ncbi:uncharacterized protein LOC123988990 [Osmia bicornis bicornis]|uniref:uncharacterized protein LOC123988990 n=1 Tax=Osmia bicornis bicornis TaxID=1437191 RepID=UPI001EAEF3E1|nr:uncharacterized protein LOC123988990 [Osmia bicornis bicornis]
MGTAKEMMMEETSDSEWETVQRRKRETAIETGRNRLEGTRRQEEARTPKERKAIRDTPRKRPIRPQAIAVRFGKETSFADILKKVKGAAGPAPEGVKTVKQTRAGNLLIEFAQGADLDNFKKVIDGKLGMNVEVASLQQRADIELKGIDPSADKTEVMEAIKRELGYDANDVKIKVFRTDPRQNKIAIIEGPAVEMGKLTKKARIRIGWTTVPVKEIPRLLRCYRCHEFGHVASNCKNCKEGKSYCRKCGSEDHDMRGCDKEPRCRLCLKDKLPEEEVKHVAASVRCRRAAHDLLMTSANKYEVDIIIVSEPYRVMENWFVDNTGRAAICITSKGLDVGRNVSLIKSGDGFVVIKYNSFYITSVYASPNDTMQGFEALLASLAMEVRSLAARQDEIIIMGDFNAKSPLWGADKWCNRGRVLLQFCNSADLLTTITKGGATCDRGRGTKIDIMTCNRKALYSLTESMVVEDFTASDHRYLLHTFNLTIAQDVRASPFDIKKGKLDEEGFVEAFVNKYGDDKFEARPRTHSTVEVDRFLEDLERLVKRHTRYNGSAHGKRIPVPWWNEEIASKRKLAQTARRRLTRDKAGTDLEAIQRASLAYKKCKQDLNREIRNAKRENWAKLLQEIDRDIWGRPYKVVMRTIKNKDTTPEVLSPDEVDNIVAKLFILEPDLEDLGGETDGNRTADVQEGSQDGGGHSQYHTEITQEEERILANGVEDRETGASAQGNQDPHVRKSL